MLQRVDTSLIWNSVLPRSVMRSEAADMILSRVAALFRVLALDLSLEVCFPTLSWSCSIATELAS